MVLPAFTIPIVRVLRGGVLYAVLGPPIGLVTVLLYGLIEESLSKMPPPPTTSTSWFEELPALVGLTFLAYPYAWLPAFLTGVFVGLVAYKGLREKRSSLAMKSFVIGAIVSFLYFGGWQWPSIWRYLSFSSIEALAPLVAAGLVAAAISSLLFYRYVNPGHRKAQAFSRLDS